MNPTVSGRLQSIGEVIPGLMENRGKVGPTHAIQRYVSRQLGPPLLVDGATYKQTVFIAPCDGCVIKEIWLTAAVAIAGGTNTLAVDNYDASGNAARNVLSTTNMDPTGVTAKEGTKLTLSTTEANLVMDEGDVLNTTLVCGTMTTDGEGYTIEAIIFCPEIE